MQAVYGTPVITANGGRRLFNGAAMVRLSKREGAASSMEEGQGESVEMFPYSYGTIGLGTPMLGGGGGQRNNKGSFSPVGSAAATGGTVQVREYTVPGTCLFSFKNGFYIKYVVDTV